MSVGSIPIYPSNLDTFEESWIFMDTQKAPFERPSAPKRDIADWAHIAYF